MNWQGLIVVAMGIALIILAASGRYRQAWAVISGTPEPPLTPATAPRRGGRSG